MNSKYYYSVKYYPFMFWSILYYKGNSLNKQNFKPHKRWTRSTLIAYNKLVVFNKE